MKEITIKIKPKLKWFHNTPVEECFYSQDNKMVTIYEIKKDFNEWALNVEGFYNIGYFKTIKTAKAVAELLYQGK